MMRIPLKALVYVEGETDIPIVRAVMRAACLLYTSDAADEL